MPVHHCPNVRIFFFLETNFLKLSPSIIGFFRITCNLINSVCNLKVLLKIRHTLLQRYILPYHFRLVTQGSLTSLISRSYTEMSFSTLHTYLIVKPYHAYLHVFRILIKQRLCHINIPRCYINSRILPSPIEVCSVIMFCDIIIYDNTMKSRRDRKLLNLIIFPYSSCVRVIINY